MKRSRTPYLFALVALCACLLCTSSATAQEQQPAELVDTDDEQGFHMLGKFALRAVPEGVKLNLIPGHRWRLSTSDSLLLKDTYMGTGLTSEITPANLWAGPYFEVLPLAVLQLYFSAQWIGYYGTFGYLHTTADTSPSNWTLDAVDAVENDGQSATGVKLDARVTPRAKVGNIVFLGETTFTWVDMDVDLPYYESTFDWLLEPEDGFWLTKPTLGYVFTFEDSWFLASGRWEHGQTIRTGLSRDMAAFVGLWKMPWTWGEDGEMKLASVLGWWVNHPNRKNSVYAAVQYSVEWAPF